MNVDFKTIIFLIVASASVWLYSSNIYIDSIRPFTEGSSSSKVELNSIFSSSGSSKLEKGISDFKYHRVSKDFSITRNQKENTQNDTNTKIVLDGKNKNIFTFVQISDLHISKFSKKGGYIHFLHFLKTSLKLISPNHLIITGDLTDGKDEESLSSLQQIDEWKAYKKTMDDIGLPKRSNSSFVFDIRGNHDCFNTGDWESETNYYRTYGVTKQPGFVLKSKLKKDTLYDNESSPESKYCFIAGDACPKLGFGRPLNFFGYFEYSQVKLLESQISNDCADADHIFMLNHYPIGIMKYGASIMPTNPDSKAFSRVSVFLCGHLHHLALGLGKQLQFFHKSAKPQSSIFDGSNPQKSIKDDDSGFLELELGDMKAHAVFRVYAIENNLLSFSDVVLPLPEIPFPNPNKENPLDVGIDSIETIPHPPIVVITNPKDSRYNIPSHEDLELIHKSTHIRTLVYSTDKVNSVKIFIDNVFLGTATPEFEHLDIETRWKKSDDSSYIPLYVLSWKPINYKDGKRHEIRVEVSYNQDQKENTLVKKSIFILNDSRLSIDNFMSGGLILSTNFSSFLMKLAIYNYFIGMVVVLLLPKLLLLVKFGKGNNLQKQSFDSWIKYQFSLVYKDTKTINSNLKNVGNDTEETQVMNTDDENFDETLNTQSSGDITTSGNSTSSEFLNNENTQRNELLRPNGVCNYENQIINKETPPRNLFGWCLNTIKILFLRLILLISNPAIFWPLYIYGLLIAVFPLFIGDLIPANKPKNIGLVYGYGIYIDKTWVPLPDTWTHALSAVVYPLIFFPLYLISKLPRYSFNKSLSVPTIENSANVESESKLLQLYWRLFRISMVVFNYMNFMFYIVIPLIMNCYIYGSFIVLFSSISRFWIGLYIILVLWYVDISSTSKYLPVDGSARDGTTTNIGNLSESRNNTKKNILSRIIQSIKENLITLQLNYNSKFFIQTDTNNSCQENEDVYLSNADNDIGLEQIQGKLVTENQKISSNENFVKASIILDDVEIHTDEGYSGMHNMRNRGRNGFGSDLEFNSDQSSDSGTQSSLTGNLDNLEERTKSKSKEPSLRETFPKIKNSDKKKI
ncbi:hypothetical protein BB558_000084 [Smittium angustum]|uniref:Uncharacterized protein n=1 Tax=Smittium angustum TaxID=133377 RepID=A0A2U1JFP6_SMIAN|nr:hypothetical protein BB558_000084 [Smittium angustum]